MKERKEKAEADIAVVTLSVTYHCVCERKLAKMKRNQRNMRRAAGKKTGRKRAPIPKVKNDKRETITSREGTANVFGELYSKLFAKTQPGKEAQETRNMETKMGDEKKS